LFCIRAINTRKTTTVSVSFYMIEPSTFGVILDELMRILA
jgi:hypothetical protein